MGNPALRLLSFSSKSLIQVKNSVFLFVCLYRNCFKINQTISNIIYIHCTFCYNLPEHFGPLQMELKLVEKLESVLVAVGFVELTEP